jgi:hypothetical protein
VTEFWKSAPSLLTFLDAKYALLKHLQSNGVKVPRALLAPANDVGNLVERNHRISLTKAIEGRAIQVKVS